MSCDACQMVAINGIATHETGCPNTPRECFECGTDFVGHPAHRICPDCRNPQPEDDDVEIT